MSKSYRYDPEEEAVANRPSWERPEEDFGFDEPEAKPQKRRRKAKVTRPTLVPMTPEWAIDLMKDYVGIVLNGLVERGIIVSHEREDYEQILNAHICRILPLYNPHHVGKSGKCAGVERYLTVAVNSASADIVRHAMAAKRNLPTTELPELDDDEAGDDERKECDSDALSDKYKSVRNLWFWMDYATLMGMLAEDERIALSLRMEGCTYPEIASEVNRVLGWSIDRFYIMDKTMERLRLAARKCGFVPYIEMREKKS